MMLHLRKRNPARSVERRRFTRLKEPLNVKYKIVGPDSSSRVLNGITKDISVDGICLETNIVQIDEMHISHDSSMLYKNMIEMEIDIIFRDSQIKAAGDVCWYDLARETGEFKYEVGISFSDINDDCLDKLRVFLEQKDT